MGNPNIDSDYVKWSQLSCKKKIGAIMRLSVLVCSFVFLLFVACSFVYLANQQQTAWQNSELQDKANFEKLFATTSIQYRAEAKKADVIAIKSKEAKVKAKLLDMANTLASQEKELEKLWQIENTDTKLRLSEISAIEEKMEVEKKEFVYCIRLAYRFATTSEYADVYERLDNPNSSWNWKWVLNKIQSANSY